MGRITHHFFHPPGYNRGCLSRLTLSALLRQTVRIEAMTWGAQPRQEPVMLFNRLLRDGVKEEASVDVILRIVDPLVVESDHYGGWRREVVPPKHLLHWFLYPRRGLRLFRLPFLLDVCDRLRDVLCMCLEVIELGRGEAVGGAD